MTQEQMERQERVGVALLKFMDGLLAGTAAVELTTDNGDGSVKRTTLRIVPPAAPIEEGV